MQPRHLFGMFAVIIVTAQAPATFAAIDVPSGRYVPDMGHAYITFSYSHLGFSTPHIAFTDFDVDLQLDAENPQNSQLAVTIDANSIESRVDEFDEHLVGERFFDTAKYPTITFTSTGIELGNANTATITGDLTIKGKTQPVILTAVLNKAGNHPMLKKPVAGFNAETKLSRTAWGLGYAAPMVGDEVTVYISVELQLDQ